MRACAAANCGGGAGWAFVAALVLALVLALVARLPSSVATSVAAALGWADTQGCGRSHWGTSLSTASKACATSPPRGPSPPASAAGCGEEQRGNDRGVGGRPGRPRARLRRRTCGLGRLGARSWSASCLAAAASAAALRASALRSALGAAVATAAAVAAAAAAAAASALIPSVTLTVASLPAGGVGDARTGWPPPSPTPASSACTVCGDRRGSSLSRAKAPSISRRLACARASIAASSAAARALASLAASARRAASRARASPSSRTCASHPSRASRQRSSRAAASRERSSRLVATCAATRATLASAAAAASTLNPTALFGTWGEERRCGAC